AARTQQGHQHVLLEASVAPRLAQPGDGSGVRLFNDLLDAAGDGRHLVVIHRPTVVGVDEVEAPPAGGVLRIRGPGRSTANDALRERVHGTVQRDTLHEAAQLVAYVCRAR